MDPSTLDRAALGVASLTSLLVASHGLELLIADPLLLALRTTGAFAATCLLFTGLARVLLPRSESESRGEPEAVASDPSVASDPQPER